MLPLVNRPHLNSTFNKCDTERVHVPVYQRAGAGGWEGRKVGREGRKGGREGRPVGWAGGREQEEEEGMRCVRHARAFIRFRI